MRRLLSILLLAAFGLPVAAPALALTTSPTSTLPACCRRTGAHHCGMPAAQRSNAPTVAAICPNFPQPTATSPATTLYADTDAPHPILFTRPTRTSTRPAPPLPLSHLDLSHPKRGPPTLL